MCKGVGEKTARALVQEFPSIDAMLEAAEAGALVIKPGVRAKLLESKGYLDDMRRLVPVNGEAPLSLWAGERDPSPDRGRRRARPEGPGAAAFRGARERPRRVTSVLGPVAEPRTTDGGHRPSRVPSRDAADRSGAPEMPPSMAMTSHNVGMLHPEAGAAFEELVERFHLDNPTFRISDDVIRRYHLATYTRGFVILCGPSGTGKTWLAQAYAERDRRPPEARRGRPELVVQRRPARLPLPARRLLPPHAVQRVRRRLGPRVEREQPGGPRGARVPRDLGRDEPGPGRALLQPVPVGDGGAHPRGHRAPGPRAGSHGRADAEPEVLAARSTSTRPRTGSPTRCTTERRSSSCHCLGSRSPRTWRSSPGRTSSCRCGTPSVEVAPFGFRVLDEINAYVIAATEIGTDATPRARRAARAEGAPAPARRQRRRALRSTRSSRSPTSATRCPTPRRGRCVRN